ncbi:deoxyribonucleoside regulator [Thermanaeromonas toyohensis ToBE]|uniref:Deoxyribonucleoside regulator n=1 Tax=Thermanaeromonas toyohensis ToBE TaxID=698762 RepID=A0A1W1V9I5_9FIRM|nr:sugar-binding transcriptional regulator [Thermanaeromonas toyohensis]SMB89701.1 deoxyribonucleoside regulator [Thermanaeromonas toyohensis ToBE]
MNSEIKTIIQVARLYYEKGLTQQEIATEMQLSRSTVSRLLEKARKEGFVEIRVLDPYNHNQDLARTLQQRFNLKACVITSTGVSERTSRRAIGLAAAGLLDEILKEGDVLGVSWGSTLYELAINLNGVTPRAIQVVPLLGGMGQLPRHFQVNELANMFAQAFGGTAYALHAPALVGSAEVKRALINDPSLRPVISLWSQITVAVVGIGPPISVSPMLSTNYFGDSDVLALMHQGAVGDICARFFNEYGRLCQASVNERIIAVDLEDLRRIPTVIGVAGGPEKVRSILGALRGRWINTLVTDLSTAEELIRSIREDRLE